MRKENLVILILVALIFGVFTFVYVQKASCENNPFKGILSDADIAKYDQQPKILTDADIARFDKEQQRIRGIREFKERIVVRIVVSAIPIILIIVIFIFKKKIFMATKKGLDSIYYFRKFIMGVLFRNKSTIGKFIISLIAIFAFYKCAINPPVYYRDFRKNKVYDKKEAFEQVSTVDIYKLASEMFGMAILTGLVYFLLVKKSGKNS